jgi:uncharacterized protein YndB with AHSA1/START domain
MLLNILLVLAAVLAGLILLIATRPAHFCISRSTTIEAPPATIFAHVNQFRAWEAWSPWEKLDPALQRNYEGPVGGEGAVYRWIGNQRVGEGAMTITESRPNALIEIRLEFQKPFACRNAVDFTFKPEGDRTTVTWNMAGQNNFVAKAMHLIMSMDKMVGGQFEQGLAQL